MSKLNDSNIIEIAMHSNVKMKKYFKKLKEPFHFVRHFPAYMDYEPFETDFDDINEILNLEEISWWKGEKDFYGYFIDMKNSKTVGIALMALYKYNPEYYGCTSWYCLGYITKGNDGRPNLPLAQYAIHKPNCKYRKYKSIENDLIPLSEDERKKMLDEVGLSYTIWKEDDLCDCGFMKLK